MVQQKEQIKASKAENKLAKNRQIESGKPQKSPSKFKARATAIASILGMLPVLAIGTSTYYFASKAIKQQIAEVNQQPSSDRIATRLEQQQQQLAILSIGTGLTALLGGAIFALWTNRSLNLALKGAKKSTTGENARGERSEILSEAIQNIRSSLQKQDILENTVEEVKRILQCDRVVIYSLEDKSRGKVVAESVEPRWPRALGRTITDPCFDAKYAIEYQNGRVRALDNIYTSGMSACYIEQLEKLEVKANLVAPVINEGKLLGLLVAHQCSEPRTWQQWEVDLAAQLAAQVGFALDNASLLAKATIVREQLETETEWTHYFTDAIQNIRASLKEKDVLKAVVKEVRSILRCDRVVIYSLEDKTRGKVIAESVAPGRPRALGRTITDPCFDAKYQIEYQNGRVRALDNIYEAGMTPCYIEQLEKLEVKANLVAPILNEGKLLGLLVAHQCSEPRIWQQLEIRWFAQISVQVGFAIDNARVIASSALVKQERDIERDWTNFFTDAVQYIRSSLKEEDILENSVEEVQKILECDRVVIYSLEDKSRGKVTAESVVPRRPRALGRVIKDPCFDAKYQIEYQNGRVRALNNIYEAGMTPCYIEQLEKLEVKANLVAPILNEGKLLGLLVAHQCSEPRTWQDLEMRWFAHIAAQIGFAIDNARVIANSALMYERVEQMSQQAVIMAREQHLLQAELPKLFGDKGISLADFLEDLQNQEDKIALLTEQIQAIVNSASEVVAKVEVAAAEVSQTGNSLANAVEPIGRSQDNTAAIATALEQTSKQLENLNNSCDLLTEIDSAIKDLTERINEQTLNLTIETGKGEEQIESQSITSAIGSIYTLTQQLKTAVAEINPVISQIDTEVQEVAMKIDTLQGKGLTTTELLTEIKQQFEQITTCAAATENPIEQIVKTANSQLQTATAAGGAIVELIELNRKTTERSTRIADYLNQLDSVTNKIETT